MCDEEAPSVATGLLRRLTFCLSCEIRLFFADAQTVDATARLTNIQFSADLQNTSSQAYKTISESIAEEVGTVCYKDHPVTDLWSLFRISHTVNKALFHSLMYHYYDPLSPIDLPVSVSRDEDHGRFRPGENQDQKLFTGQCCCQLHHHRHPQTKPRHQYCVLSSAIVADKQFHIHCGHKQHKHKWYVSYNF